jgi:C1A family cysteine protease
MLSFKKTILALVLVFILLSTHVTAFYNQQTKTDTSYLIDSEKKSNIEDNLPNSNFIPICQTMEKELIITNSNYPKPQINETPPSFSWKNNNGDWTTKARYQGNCGSCWAFATNAIIESVINIKENNPDLDPDLSEQYILSCLPSAGSCEGGSTLRALENIIDADLRGNYCNGVPLESCMPYQGDDTVPCSDKCAGWNEKLVPILDYGNWNSDGSEDDIQRIKTMIMEKGPVASGIYANYEFINWGILNHKKTDYYPNEKPVIWSNHVIMIVGWHDDPLIDHGGYWICKNSWSTFWGYDGFFNVEYGALGIDHGYIIWVDYNEESFDWLPVAVINSSFYGNIGENIQFSANNSFDVEGDIVEYIWDFGDGSNGTGASVVHAFEENGIYNVNLTVIDEKGKQNTETKAVFVDIWSIGDYWKYSFDKLDLDFAQGQTELSLDASITSIIFEIDKVKTDKYTMKFTGEINADINLKYNNMDIFAKLSQTNIDGKIIFSKQNQGIKKIECNLLGKVRFTKIIPIPFSFRSEILMEFNDDFKYLDFPLDDKKDHEMPYTEFTLNGQISSPILEIINIFNKIAFLFKIELIPQEFARFLPVIRFEEILNDLTGENILVIPTISKLSISESKITVPSGTYDSYKIKSNWVGSIYYSHNVENIIKIDITPLTISTTSGDLNLAVKGELIETNYN